MSTERAASAPRATSLAVLSWCVMPFSSGMVRTKVSCASSGSPMESNGAHRQESGDGGGVLRPPRILCMHRSASLAMANICGMVILAAIMRTLNALFANCVEASSSFSSHCWIVKARCAVRHIWIHLDGTMPLPEVKLCIASGVTAMM